MLTTGLAVIREKTVAPSNYALLLDLTAIADDTLCVVGSSVRINSLENDSNGFTATACGPDNVRANIRLRLPRKPSGAECSLTPVNLDSEDKSSAPDTAPTPVSAPVSASGQKSTQVTQIAMDCVWDEESRTALLSYDSAAGDIVITGKWE
jgi:hypothetical protein